jgi:hypothetical protein
MSSNTDKFNLYKTDPATDGTDTFDIDLMMNQNWDRLDKEAVREPFRLKAAVYDSTNNKIDATLGPGIADFLQTIITKTTDSVYSIPTPAINTSYYIYLKNDGTFTHNTYGAEVDGAVKLWIVATGSTVDAVSTTDQRGRVSGSAQVVKDLFDSHKLNAVLDHPDGSVTTPKVADGSIITSKLANKPMMALAAANLLNPNRMVFERASEAYKKNGEKVDYSTPRSEEGKFGQGIFIEEGTTNLLSENQSDIEIDTSGFVTFNAAVISRDTSKAWHGNASLKVACDGTQQYQGVATTYSTNIQGTYIGQVRITGMGTIEVWIRANYTDGTFAEGTRQSVTLNSNWVKAITQAIKTDGAKTVSSTDFHIRQPLASSVTFWVDGLQLENKEYATSWHIGTKERKGDNLYYVLEQKLPSDFFVCGRFKPEFGDTRESTTGNTFPKIINIYIDSQNRYHFSYIANSTNGHKGKFYFEKWIAGVSNNVIASSIPFPKGDDIFFAFAQLTTPIGDLSAGMHLWLGVNGGLYYFNNTSDTALDGATDVYVGNRQGEEGANGVIDFPIITNIIPTSEQVEALYRASEWGGLRNFPKKKQTDLVLYNANVNDFKTTSSTYVAGQEGHILIPEDGNYVIESQFSGVVSGGTGQAKVTIQGSLVGEVMFTNTATTTYRVRAMLFLKAGSAQILSHALNQNGFDTHCSNTILSIT